MLAWQHGANLGHFSRLAAIGQWAAEERAVLVWAVPARYLHDPAWGQQGNTPRNARVVAPGWAPIPRPAMPVSFAGVLDALGYADPDRLTTAVGQWLMLFEQLRIDRVVVDYAPAAMIAAAWAGIPTLHLTNGFDAPPPDAPPFDLRPGKAQARLRHERSKASLDRSLAAAASKLKDSFAATWDQVLEWPSRMYDCVPEVDPYAPRRTTGRYVGPVGSPTQVHEVRWPRQDGRPEVFVYVRDSSCHKVLEALTEVRWGIHAQVICYWPQAGEADIGRWRNHGVALVNQPVALTSLLAECSMVVTYGAAAVTCRALLAGVPQLILPIDAEKDLIARRVEACGAGIRLPWQSDACSIATAAKAVLTDPAMGLAAKAIAARHADLPGQARTTVQVFLGAVHATKPSPQPKGLPVAPDRVPRC